MQYNYDQNGAIFAYFLVTIFSLVLIPVTFQILSSKSSSVKLSCTCENCLKKASLLGRRRKKKPVVKYLILLAAWVLYFFVIYQSMTLKQEEEVLWDPYRILNVDEDADERTIKKAFKKLSLIYHPDKVKDENREEAEGKFVDISKAYKVLTDEEARALFDEFGHPDGKQAFELGLALPAWLVEKGNSSLVLLVYGMVFGLGLPVLVARWWRNAKVMAKNKILNETMGIFYRDLNDNLGFKGLIELLSKAQEYELLAKDFPVGQALWAKFEKQLDQELSKFSFDLKTLKKNQSLSDYQKKIISLILAHCCRLFPSDPALAKAQIDVVDTAGLLIHGLVQISQSRNWIRVTLQIIETSQLITQAMMPKQSEFYQLPYMTPEVLKHFTTKKRNIETIAQLIKMDPTARKELLGSLSDSQLKTVESVCEQYPRIDLATAEYSVYGDPVIVPSSLVTLSVKFRCLYGSEESSPDADNSLPDPEEEKQENRKWWEKPLEDPVSLHAPYFPSARKPAFCVILANMSIGRLICMQKVYGTGKDHVVRLQFQSPPEVGTWDFQIFILSDSFVNCADLKFERTLKVSPATELPYENFDDTISEPEESIVGYEKPVKIKKSPEERGEYDDSSDSDDQSSEDEPDSGPDDEFIE